MLAAHLQGKQSLYDLKFSEFYIFELPVNWPFYNFFNNRCQVSKYQQYCLTYADVYPIHDSLFMIVIDIVIDISYTISSHFF